MLDQAQATFTLRTDGPGLYEFTSDVAAFVSKTGFASGQLTLFCRHTSASLTIQENADPDVCRDLQDFFAKLAPDDPRLYTHTAEGPDDMPAHIKSALTDVSLTIPLVQGRLALGTWQGIYLFEHRTRPHSRSVVGHLLGA
ncbi:MAG: secondary thiamine-phosphate synthase enzyme YjbQ [Magnetovibrionaceae bacterium]